MPGESIPLSSTEKEDRSPPDNVEEGKEDEAEKDDGGYRMISIPYVS